MAKNQGEIRFGVGFNVNQQSLNNIKKALKELREMSKADIEAAGGKIPSMSNMNTKSWKNDLGAMRKELDNLGKAFEAAYNPKLGTYELNKFNQSLKESGSSAQQAFQAVSAYGAQGEAALLNMTTNMLAVDRAAKQVNSTMKKLGDTMMNTLRWTITSTAINTVTGAIQQAYSYAQDLDQSLNDIRIVTGKSAEDMNKFAREANKAAKALGASTTDYTEASLIYYQQGLSDKDVKSRTDTTIKTAAVTGQSASAVSEQLTAVWNGYKVSAEESEKYIDKLAAVAASTAADLEELSTGMSKVASAANIMGVDVDQLNAQLATIVSVTREAPESIGTALKTVYARMSDIEAGLDTETTLGEYTSQMAAMGINILDANGKLRDMGAVVEEIGNKWSSLNREQQVALAQSIAGTRQYSRMMALFDNWDMYQEAMTTSMTSAGTLAAQHATYLESIEAHQEKLKASAEGLYDSIFDSEEIKRVYDLLSEIVKLVDGLVKTIGGMPGILSLAGMLFANIAKSQIADLVVQRQKNKLAQEANALQIQHGREIIQSFRANENLTDGMKSILDLEEKIYNAAQDLNDEEWARTQQLVRQINDGLQKQLDLESQLKKVAQEKNEINRALSTGVTQEIDGKTYYYDTNKESDAQHGSISDLAKKGDNLRKEIAGREAKLTNGEYKNTAQQAKTIQTLKQKLKLIDEELEKSKQLPRIQAELEKTEKAITDEKEKQALLNKQNSEKAALQEKELALKAQGQALADLTSAAMTANFSMQMLGAGINNVVDAFSGANFGVDTFLQGLSGIATSSVMMAKNFATLSKAVKTVKATTDAGAISWTAFWTAATMGLSLIITAITTVVEAVTSIVNAIQEKRKAAIEDANTAIDEAKANRKLAQSYLELYEIYNESQEITEDLKKAAEELIEEYNLESYTIRLLCGDYEALAEKARELADAERESIIDKNVIKKENAEKQMKERVKGTSWRNSGTDINGDKFHDLTILTDLTTNKNAEAINILKKAAAEAGVELYESPEKDYFSFETDGSGEEMSRLYKMLVDVYPDLPESKVKKKIKKMIEDESFASGAESFTEASTEIIEEKTAQSIADQNYDKNNVSATQFKADREALIQDAIDAGKTEEEARNLVDQQYAAAGGKAYQMVLREQWLEMQHEDGVLNDATQNILRDQMDLATFGETEFTALTQLKAKDLKDKSADEIVRMAREKAKQNQRDQWLALGDDRLEVFGSQLTKIENEKTQTAKLEKKIGLLNQEAEILERQLEVTQEINDATKEQYKTQTQDFIDLADGALGNFNIDNALQNGNFETLTDQIMGIDDADKRQELLNALPKLLEGYQAVAEIEEKEFELQEQIYEQYFEKFELLFENYDKQAETLENINSLLSSQVEILGLLGASAEDTVDYYKAMRNTSAQSWQLAHKEYTEALALYERAKADREKETRAFGEEQFVQIEENYFEAAKTAQEAMKTAIEANVTYYEQQTEVLIDNFATKLFGVAERFEDELNWVMGTNNVYVDNVDKAYRMESLRYKTNSTIASIKDLRVQERLRAIMEAQLEALAEKDQLTEKDFERAEKILEVEQARLALEEARMNKTQMRLTRGADGTYSYQYVADDTAIDEAEQRLRDAENDLYHFDKDRMEETLQNYYSSWTDTIDKIKQYQQDGFDETERAMIKDSLLSVLANQDEATRAIDAMLGQEGLSEEQRTMYLNMKTKITSGSFAMSDIDTLLDELVANGEEYAGFLSALGLDEETATTILNSALEQSASLYDSLVGDMEELGIATGTATEKAQELATAYARAAAAIAAMKAEESGADAMAVINKYNSAFTNVSAFDTGGYTGEWGESGKLAILHEKEIVLNKTDTQNLLSAIDLVRQLNLSMNATLQGFTLPENLLHMVSTLLQEVVVEQKVDISAEFPNATDRSEIAEAFNNLVNLAAQHAYKTTKT